MAETLISSLAIVTGCISAGVGVAVARNRLESANRAYHKTAALHSSGLDGWNAWFLGGFSGFSLGTQWLWAVVLWLIWTLAGLGLISLGIGIFRV